MTYALPVYARSELQFERGEGVYLYTDDKTKYLDLAAGIAVNSMGHSHPKLVEALQTQAAKLWHVSNLYNIEGLEELAEKICKASKFADKVFFCNSGAEAVECGIKMVRKYHDGVGNPDKYRIITFEGCFHGRTLATISAAKKEKVMKGFEPEVDGFDQVPFGDLEALKAAITPETGGILIEPVQGEGGIRVADTAFLKGLREICDEQDLLLFFDGIQCGMGRTGKFFSHEWADVYPDITSSAKGIASGFPFGACLANDKVAKHMTTSSHGSTYGNNPLGIKVSLAVMDLMLADGFLDNVVEMGDYFAHQLQQLQQEFPDAILEVRGKGLMVGLRTAFESRDVVQTLRKHHTLSVPAAENVVRFLPPLIITKPEIDEGVEAIRKTIQELS